MKTNPPKKLKNIERRVREYLTYNEVEKLIVCARKISRNGYRNSTMILLAYRHALRVSELINLKWGQIDLEEGKIHINRLKKGINSVHPLSAKEIRALKKIKKEYPSQSYIFISEQKAPLSDSAFRKIMMKTGKEAGFNFPLHPHMLRHSTGFKLANDGQDTRSIQHYLGHKNIQHTVRYTELASGRFNNFWGD